MTPHLEHEEILSAHRQGIDIFSLEYLFTKLPRLNEIDPNTNFAVFKPRKPIRNYRFNILYFLHFLFLLAGAGIPQIYPWWYHGDS